MQHLDIPVDGGSLHAIRFGDGPRLVVAAHGITASAMCWPAVARHLPAEWSLVALDLRGRGGSCDLPGPYGMGRHAADIAAAAEHLSDRPVALMGHSMGAYAALRAAVTRPELFDRLLLVDGGLPLPMPDGADVDAVLEATLGPAILRLRETYPSERAYLDFFRAHPALADAWNGDIEEYVRYDVGGTRDAVRSRCREAAVYEDGRSLLVEAASFGTDLTRLTVPTLLLHAPAGMFGQPPGLLPEELVEDWASRVEGLRVELVGDTNHYTVLMGDKGAATVAGRLVETPG